MLKYDDAETYFLNFTRGLPNAAGGIPIGLQTTGGHPPLAKSSYRAKLAD
jgi:hypothetical protein